MTNNTHLLSDSDQYKARIARCPAGRWVNFKDFVGPTVFLCSAASQYVSGEVLVVDSGVLGR